MRIRKIDICGCRAFPLRVAARRTFARVVQRGSIAAGVSLGQEWDVNEDVTKLNGIPMKVLGRLLVQPGALQHDIIPLAMETALQRIHEMDAKDCIRIVQALLQSNIRPEDAALRQMGERIGRGLNEISTADMAELVKNLGDASLPDVPIFARLSVAFSARCSGATATQLTNVAAGFANARLSDSRLFPRLAQSAMKQLHVFSTAELPVFLAAFATVGQCHEALLVSAAKVLVGRSERLSSLDLALVAFSYAQFWLVFPAVVAMLRKRLPMCAQELPPLRLAELAVSCARLELREPRLFGTFALGIELGELSQPLFGQVAKSLAQLDLVSHPNLEGQLAQECQRRSTGGALEVSGSSFSSEMPSLNSWGGQTWILDLLECLGEASANARKRHGGVCPRFVSPALHALVPALVEVCGSSTPREIAVMSRCLRQLPPSLAIPRSAERIWEVHDTLLDRAAGLARAEAFELVELTSTLYSQMCLCSHVWTEQGEVSGPVNPALRAKRELWQSMLEAWWESDVPGFGRGAAGQGASAEEREMLRQIELLQLLRDQSTAATEVELNGRPPAGLEQGPDYQQQILGPVLLELHEVLESISSKEVLGPMQRGPLEVQALLGNHAFLLLKEEDYFLKPDAGVAFEEIKAVGLGEASTDASKYELCLEKAVEMRLLERVGCRVTAVPFSKWRQLSFPSRQAFLSEALRADG